MLKQLILAVIVLLTAVAAVSADIYISSSGPGWVGNSGSVSVNGRGYNARGVWTPQGGVYVGGNRGRDSVSVGVYDGAVSSASIRTRDVRGSVYRVSDDYQGNRRYAGGLGVGSNIRTPTYYNNGQYYGGFYGHSNYGYNYNYARMGY